MILVRMGDDNRLEINVFVFDKANIGKHQIDARQVRTGKCHAAIDHDPFAMPFATIAVERQIHSDLADATKRQKYQFLLLCHKIPAVLGPHA